MKRLITVMLVAGVIAVPMTSTLTPAYASDWDKAGKAFAILEGARVLTGGNIDIVGNLTGINRGNGGWGGLFGQQSQPVQPAQQVYYARQVSYRPEPVWVPEYTWEEQYIPEHEAYSEQYGTVIVEGHYIRYRVESGGRWE